MAVLEILEEQPAHPYEIQQVMRDRQRDRLVKLTTGSLYHSVERLERLGLIKPVDTTRQGRLPERTVYTITEEGRAAFLGRLREMLSAPADEFPEFPVALALLHTLDREEAIERLNWRAAILEALIAGCEVMANRLAEFDVEPMFFIDLDWQICSRRAELKWINNLVERLRSGSLHWDRKAAAPPSRLSLIEGSGKPHGSSAEGTDGPREGAAS
ncbi:PadR family transcriptional regulator [Streptomyces sp. NPDC048506]|uniref:PadR family transcriptional regulator n=1 Tax=Streptomyces sp. NPDC048506 TaxID=3155028 RepID=UPI00341EDDC6